MPEPSRSNIPEPSEGGPYLATPELSRSGVLAAPCAALRFRACKREQGVFFVRASKGDHPPSLASRSSLRSMATAAISPVIVQSPAGIRRARCAAAQLSEFRACKRDPPPSPSHLQCVVGPPSLRCGASCTFILSLLQRHGRKNGLETDSTALFSFARHSPLLQPGAGRIGLCSGRGAVSGDSDTTLDTVDGGLGPRSAPRGLS